ncbi:hypothetical protein DFS33DRAFT_214751 [Desarmillaria ectypa]|nr:hypothetical protein DFS33DRAFT_214751 [Desarmillaria ectypa]
MLSHPFRQSSFSTSLAPPPHVSTFRVGLSSWLYLLGLLGSTAARRRAEKVSTERPVTRFKMCAYVRTYIFVFPISGSTILWVRMYHELCPGRRSPDEPDRSWLYMHNDPFILILIHLGYVCSRDVLFLG